MSFKQVILSLLALVLSGTAFLAGVFCLCESVVCLMQVNQKALGATAHNIGAVTIYEPELAPPEERTPEDQGLINAAIIWWLLSVPSFFLGVPFINGIFHGIISFVGWLFTRQTKGEAASPPSS